MFSKKYIFWGIILFLNLLNPSTVMARWGNEKDAPAIIEFFNREVHVDKEGKVEEITEFLVKILNEEGRNIYGTQTILYNDDNETVEILSAKTLFDLKETEIDLLSNNFNLYSEKFKIKYQDIDQRMIEQRPIASHTLSFDSISQLLISYPSIEIGSWIYLKLKRITKSPPITGYFSSNFYYGQQSFWKRSQLLVRSELPFNIKVNDLEKNLSLTQTKENNIHILKVIQNKPLSRFLINEPDNSLRDKAKDVFVQVSTCSDYKSLGKALSSQYEEVINQPLPIQFNSLRETALKEKNEVTKINLVTSHLIDKMHYMGDWRSVKGRFIPQSLENFSNYNRGDCKDFSALTAKILRSLGFKAYVSLIYRGNIYKFSKSMLPAVENFNHVIVKVIGPSGKVYWIDPTNQVSMANGIFEDISDRETLVLDQENSFLDRVPARNPDHAKIHINEIIKYKENSEDIQVTGTVNLEGEFAAILTGADLFASKENIKEVILDKLEADKDVYNSHIERENLNSRIVKDLSFSFSYEQRDKNFLTNQGRHLT